MWKFKKRRNLGKLDYNTRKYKMIYSQEYNLHFSFLAFIVPAISSARKEERFALIPHTWWKSIGSLRKYAQRFRAPVQSRFQRAKAVVSFFLFFSFGRSFVTRRVESISVVYARPIPSFYRLTWRASGDRCVF